MRDGIDFRVNKEKYLGLDTISILLWQFFNMFIYEIESIFK